jgi:hypothetical protein
MGLDTKIYWLTDRQSQYDFDSDYDFESSRFEFRDSGLPGYELGSRGIELS